MSDRNMARIYAGGNMAGNLGEAGGGLIDMIANFTGGNDISGGYSVDPQTGQVVAMPFKGGWHSKRMATMLNAQGLGNAYQIQQQGIIEKQLEQMKNDNAVALSKLESTKKLAEYLHVPVDDIAGQLADQLHSNASQMLTNQGDANNPQKNPNIGKANQMGANIAASGINPAQLSANVGLGGMAITPNVVGVDENILRGGTQTQSIAGGFPMPNDPKDPSKGSTMVGGHPVSTMSPGTYTPAPTAVNPSIKAGILNGGTNIQAQPSSYQGDSGEQYTPGQSTNNVQARPSMLNQLQSMIPQGPGAGLIPQGLNMLQQNAPAIGQAMQQATDTMQNPFSALMSSVPDSIKQYLMQQLWTGNQQTPQQQLPSDQTSSAIANQKRMQEILAQPQQ